MAWIHATGWASVPLLLLYLLARGAAFRHSFGEAILRAPLFPVATWGCSRCEGSWWPPRRVTPRIAYTFLAGVCLISREIRGAAWGGWSWPRAPGGDARLRLAPSSIRRATRSVGLAPTAP